MSKREMPDPIYAAAGAGDLAYQRLRKLPETASRTLRSAGEAAVTLRERVATGESRLNRDRLAVDVAKLRESAQRGANVVAASAVVAQEKAVTGYRRLVAHGEQVMAARNGESTATVEPAEIAVASAAAEQAAAAEVEQPGTAGAPGERPVG